MLRSGSSRAMSRAQPSNPPVSPARYAMTAALLSDGFTVHKAPREQQTRPTSTLQPFRPAVSRSEGPLTGSEPARRCHRPWRGPHGRTLAPLGQSSSVTGDSRPRGRAAGRVTPTSPLPVAGADGSTARWFCHLLAGRVVGSASRRARSGGGAWCRAPDWHVRGAWWHRRCLVWPPRRPPPARRCRAPWSQRKGSRARSAS